MQRLTEIRLKTAVLLPGRRGRNREHEGLYKRSSILFLTDQIPKNGMEKGDFLLYAGQVQYTLRSLL